MIPHRDCGFRLPSEISHVRSESPVTLKRNVRSRSIGIVGHVAPETSVTLIRNTHQDRTDDTHGQKRHHRGPRQQPACAGQIPGQPVRCRHRRAQHSDRTAAGLRAGREPEAAPALLPGRRRRDQGGDAGRRQSGQSQANVIGRFAPEPAHLIDSANGLRRFIGDDFDLDFCVDHQFGLGRRARGFVVREELAVHAIECPEVARIIKPNRRLYHIV